MFDGDGRGTTITDPIGPARTPLGDRPGVAASRGGRLGYQPALDGLRGVAVVAVLLFHAGHLEGGFLGVDLFFTLSGYLITSLLLAEHRAAGRISLGRFWSRRARRLLPALYVVLGAVIAYTVIWARADALSRIRGDAIAALLYIANWHTIAGGGDYWDRFAAPSPLEHLWSLAVEEQFYIVWPIVVIAVLAWGGRRALLWTATTLTAASAAWMALLAARGASLNRIYLGTDTRVASILLGAVLAVVLMPQRERDEAGAGVPSRLTRTVTVAAGAACVGLVWAWATVDGATSDALYRGGFLLHAAAVGVVIVAVTLAPASPLARGLGAAPLRLVGLISYGLYLWHWPVYLVLTEARTGRTGWSLTALRIAASVVLAVISYLLVEQPVHAGAVRPSILRIALPVSVAALVVGFVLATVAPPAVDFTRTAVVPTTTPGPVAAAAPAPGEEPAPAPAGAAPGDAPAPAAPTAAATPPDPLLRTVPALSPTPPVQLRTPTAEDPLRVLLFGDSYMFDAAPGMTAALTSTGVVEPTEAGLWGFTITNDDWAGTVDALLQEHRPELVVAMWARFDVSWMEEHDAQAYLVRLREAVGKLVGSGAAVAIVGLAPSQISGLDTRAVDREINELFVTVAEEFPGQAFYIDPDPIVAPDGEPALSIDVPEGSLRVRKVDLSHYCPDGSARFGEAVTRLLGPLAGVPEPDPALWIAGEWRNDQRYNEPRGVCT